MVVELVSRLSLANHSDSGSFLVVCTSFSQGDSSEEDSGRLAVYMNWRPLSPFDFSQILQLAVACSFCIPYQDGLL